MIIPSDLTNLPIMGKAKRVILAVLKDAIDRHDMTGEETDMELHLAESHLPISSGTLNHCEL